uniref:Uncharacterized protein n=1 Tax=Callorhinchus milii TaxID=7868 RepID=A0A4W3I8U5_CALMI
MNALLVDEKPPGVLQGVQSCLREVRVSCAQQVKEARLEVQILHRKLLLAFGSCCLLGKRARGGSVLPAGRLWDHPVHALVGWAATQTQLESLPFLEGVHDILGHEDSKHQVSANLPHHDGGPNVRGQDLHMLPSHPLPHLQAARPRPLPTRPRAVHKCRWQVVALRLVNLLHCAARETLEDHRELPGKQTNNRKRAGNGVGVESSSGGVSTGTDWDYAVPACARQAFLPCNSEVLIPIKAFYNFQPD